jgi:hypothetical protein
MRVKYLSWIRGFAMSEWTGTHSQAGVSAMQESIVEASSASPASLP